MPHEHMGCGVGDGNVLPGKYTLGEQIGRGGMGVVHVALSQHDERVAIKLLHPEHVNDRYSRACMRREVMAGMRVCHPNVVAVLGFHDVLGETPFVVMEYARGVSLGTMLEREGTISLVRAIDIACAILDGLGAIHAAGFVHADIKSDNILVESTPDGIAVKIIDLGLATEVIEGDPIEPERSADGKIRVMSGTPDYMAPEVIRGSRVTPASDLYAVGVILYEMLTGETPFDSGITNAVLGGHLDQPVIPPSLRRPDRAIPIALERAVLRALEKNPATRFDNADYFAAMLRTAAAAAKPEPDWPPDDPIFDSWVSPTPSRTARPRLAAGSRYGSNERVRELRAGILQALKRDELDDVITGSLEVARVFVDEHSLWAARAELEDTIDVLTRGAGIESPDAPSSLWRLLVTLAALYSGLRDPIRARRTALAAHLHAVRHDSDLGRERAAALLTRLGRT